MDIEQSVHHLLGLRNDKIGKKSADFQIFLN